MDENEEKEEEETSVVGEDNQLSLENIEEKLKDLWAKVEAVILNDGDVRKKASQIGETMHLLVDFLIKTSNHKEYDDMSCSFCQHNNVFNRIYCWTGQHRECLKQMAWEQLSYFFRIVSVGGIKLLTCKGVVIPLTLLLLSLKPTDKRKIPPDVETLYVNILYHISQRISNQDFLELLAEDIYTDEGFKIAKFTFFELLILYTHSISNFGDTARAGILSCIDNSSSHCGFQQYIHQESACVIIAGGLSARYSSLPTTLEIHTEDWHCITSFDLQNMGELQEFLMTLDFCCQVSKVGSNDIKSKLALFIHDGFLKSVLAPALNQVSIDAQIAVMAYLDLFLRTITDEYVMEVFLRVLLTEAYDNKPLVNLLIYHINSDSIQLSMVAMQLFRTLLELNCEDVIFHLIFRYLLPCHHILPNQKRTIKEMDFYCKSATMFLYLTPECCIEANRNSIDAKESSPMSQRHLSISSMESNSKNSSPSATPTRKISAASIGSSVSKNSNSSTQSELRPQETLDFMAYLHDAKCDITSCKKSCSCWSAVYDGMDVITDNPRLRNGRYSVIKNPKELVTSPSFESPEGLIFRRTLSSTSTDSDISSGMFESSKLYNTECLGPFLNSLLDRIDGMLDSNLYVNLLLTNVVSRLACYPQPLLRSFLLNANLVIRPGVRSLSQILSRVSRAANAFVSQLDDYKLLIAKAKQNLARRESRRFKRLSQDISSNQETSQENEEMEEAVAKINLNHKTGLGKFQLQRKEEKIGDKVLGADELVSLSPHHQHIAGVSINTSQIKSDEKKRTFAHSAGRLHPAIPKHVGKSRQDFYVLSKKDINDMRRKNPTAIKNAVYCVVILEEFMKELAAISIEQTLL